MKEKNSRFKMFFITALAAVGVIVAIAVLYIAYAFISYYRLEDNLSLEIKDTSDINLRELPLGTELTATSYNIGFGAYSDDFTFFMDGGKESVARSREAVYANIGGAIDTVKAFSPDIALFQEVDRDSTRSYHVDETEMLSLGLSTDRAYSYVYGQNWDSLYLMYPFNRPHGSVKSGLMTFSSYGLTSTIRRSLPIETGPGKIIEPDRCYIKSSIPVAGGRELIIYNAHLSAYTSDPKTAGNQISMIINDMQKEYDRGNFCLAGGDFNSDLLLDSPAVFNVAALEANWAAPVRTELFTDDIILVVPYDENDPHASCRNCDKPYEKGDFVVTVDGFIRSGNITVVKSDVIDTGFKYSDHNPVYIKFRLNEE